MGGEGEGWEKRVGERGSMGFSTREGWRVKGLRVGMKG
jgi:hypothetical protein